MTHSLLARHANRLPGRLAEFGASLGEGDTALIELVRLAKKEGVDLKIHAKFEGTNPTGSFKDRGMVAAVARARQQGAAAVMCASTGNTAAAAAAYAARAGLACHVLLPAGKVATGKMAQAIAHGANILLLRGNFDDAMAAVRKFASDEVVVVNSINPFRIHGQKTIAFEVIEQLGKVPDIHALPVGNAGNITAHWIGYSEAAGQPTEAGNVFAGQWQAKAPAFTERRPVMIGAQAAGSAPFVAGKPVTNPETVATAIRIGNPQSWDGAQATISESAGRILAVEDDELLRVQYALASEEGIFCEPASAAGLAAVLAEAKAGRIEPGSTVVCTLTGNGMKDPDAVAKRAKITEVEATEAAIAKALGLGN